jgi:hypothetical protein
VPSSTDHFTMPSLTEFTGTLVPATSTDPGSIAANASEGGSAGISSGNVAAVVVVVIVAVIVLCVGYYYRRKIRQDIEAATVRSQKESSPCSYGNDFRGRRIMTRVMTPSLVGGMVLGDDGVCYDREGPIYDNVSPRSSNDGMADDEGVPVRREFLRNGPEDVESLEAQNVGLMSSFKSIGLNETKLLADQGNETRIERVHTNDDTSNTDGALPEGYLEICSTGDDGSE